MELSGFINDISLETKSVSMSPPKVSSSPTWQPEDDILSYSQDMGLPGPAGIWGQEVTSNKRDSPGMGCEDQ